MLYQIGENFTLTPAGAAAELGVYSDTVYRYEFKPSASTVPPGITVTASQAQGTTDQAGTFSLAVGKISERDLSWTSVGTYTFEVQAPVVEEPAPELEEPAEPAPPEPTPAQKVAAFIGRPDDPRVLALAEVHYPIITEYVKGYTNGRGFFGDVYPDAGIAAVLITATARSVMNPENLSYFTIGDYSERPATTAGWTLHELGVLRRYRRLTNRPNTEATG